MVSPAVVSLRSARYLVDAANLFCWIVGALAYASQNLIHIDLLLNLVAIYFCHERQQLSCAMKEQMLDWCVVVLCHERTTFCSNLKVLVPHTTYKQNQEGSLIFPVLLDNRMFSSQCTWAGKFIWLWISEKMCVSNTIPKYCILFTKIWCLYIKTV